MNAIASPLLLQLSETNAHSRALALSVAGYEIRGEVALDGASLDLHGPDGTLSAERVVIASVTITGHGMRIGAQQLEAAQCTVGWGHDGVRIEATRLDVRALQVIGDDLPLEGTLILGDISLTDLAIHGDEVRLGRARIARSDIDAKFPARPAPDGEATEREQNTDASVLAWLLPLLDRLTGHLNVDLDLDLAVPILGHRRATHEFRIPIDAGTIDYRKLEDNLSTLEDSLLDFSVRDEGLVLEVGIPLLPTRGKGKPIVTWPLDAADRELAEQQRVRLSVLSRPDVNGRGDDSGDGEDKPSKFGLRKAKLDKLDIKLAIAPAEAWPIRSLGSLALTGELEVVSDADEDEDANATAVRGQIDALEVDDLHIAAGRTGAGPTRDGAGGEHAHVPHAPTK